MLTRILGGVALVLAGSAMTLAAAPYLPRDAGHDGPPVSAVADRGAARCDLPPGHPPVEACAPSAEEPALPPGHPPVGHRALPPGHPPIDGLPGHVIPLGPARPDDGSFPQGFLTNT
ncbi:MAG TPA: hypothetical protein VFP65_17005 [Anaeromyxobacteraceae bacterium]|nr:hypothetical protein [Anaeromyxobacteraceae bacterium]